jgi:hypothetical protein
MEPTYKAIVSTLKSSSRLAYLKDNNIFAAPDPTIQKTEHAVYMYPMSVSNLPVTESADSVNVSYIVIIGCRVAISTDLTEQLYGTTSKKGLMDLMSDIYFTIKDSPNFGVSSQGTSISKSGSSTQYALTESVRYLTVQLNGVEMDMSNYSGYDTIDCGISTLTGTQIASNIQTSLRALALSEHPNDPYATVTCTYDTSRKKFTITSPTEGTRSAVTVTAGASNDASSVLGFNSPKEERGANIIVSKIDLSYPLVEEYLPTISGRINLYIEEQIYFE